MIDPSAVLDRDMVNRLDALCWRFVRKHGGDWEELRAQANLDFCEACASWQRSKGTTIGTWVTAKVWWGLYSFVREQHRPRHVVVDWSKVGKPLPFDWEELLREVGEDAAFVLNLLLDWDRFPKRHPRRQQVVKALRKEGWEDVRIFGSFVDIREAIA